MDAEESINGLYDYILGTIACLDIFKPIFGRPRAGRGTLLPFTNDLVSDMG